MRTLVIGHTTGIGAELTQVLEADGVSRSTGYNINDIDKDFDYGDYSTIILNAYGDFCSQLKTLYEIVNHETYTKDTLLIVISSIRAWNYSPDTVERSKYSVEKSAINKAVNDLNGLGYNVTSVCPNYVDTDYNKLKQVPKMTVEYMALVVKRIIEDFYKFSIKTREIVIEKVQ